MEVVVGRLGRPQGLRGEVTVEVRTDEPDVRFALGASLLTRRKDLAPAPAGVPPRLVVRSARDQGGRLVLAFEGIEDRTAAEGLRDVLVAVEVDPAELPEDPEEFYDHQLVGLRADLLDGTELGTVAEVLHLPSQDVLVVRAEGRADVLVPFVETIVPVVDLADGRVAVDPPPGLLPEAATEDATEDAASAEGPQA